jgi:hypothetical protein
MTAFDGVDDDQFGYSVAIDGDTVVVGTYQDDDGTSSGSAYVFTKPAGGWANGNETGKLTASHGAQADHFGYSVAVDGDTVVVGARGDSTQAGSVYLFTKPATGWDDVNEATKITASDGDDSHRFGWSVAVDGIIVMAGAERGRQDPLSGSGLYSGPREHRLDGHLR